MVMADEPGDGQAFGGLLRDRRAAAGLTQEQLAERSGLGVRTIRELERGRVTRPQRESIGLLATALGLSAAARDELARAGRQLPPPPGPAIPAAVPASPAQLPADLPDFTGRHAHVSALSAALAAAPARTPVVVCAITGAGGAGKTSLAVHVGQRVRDHFPGGQLFIDLRGAGPQPLDPGDVLARFLRDLGMDPALVPAEPEERAARYRSLVASRRVLVVLDNASDAAQVRPLLPGGPGCAALITGRSHLPGLPADRLLDLDMLEPAEAHALLARIIGPARAAAEPQATASVVRACAGLPLAIRIAGTRLALRPGWTVSSLAGRLADHRRRLTELGVADLAVRSTFETSYRALPARAGPGSACPARAFRLLGLPAGPGISLAAASALLGQSEQDAETALQALVSAHLLEEPAAGRYRLHDLLRVYAAECAAAEETAPAREDALRRLIGWQVRTLATANEVLEPGRRQYEVASSPGPPVSFGTFDAALEWCETESDNLLASARQAAEWGMDDLACQLGIALFSYLDVRGCHPELVTVSQIGLASARSLGDREREAAALNNLGVAYEELNQLDAATEILAEALALNDQIGDPDGEIAAWGNLGNVHERAGRYPEALDCFQRTLALARATGARSYERTTLVNLGLLHNAMGQHDQATLFCEQALALCRDDGDRPREGTALVALADAYAGLRQFEQALAAYRQAQRFNEQAGAKVWRGLALLGLGDTLRDLGRPQEACAAWQEALAALAEVGSAKAQEARARLSRPG
jgi:tetratricopeptide (TPR) repeat protein/transcriptional regulator with XRE-family HTH domain